MRPSDAHDQRTWTTSHRGLPLEERTFPPPTFVQRRALVVVALPDDAWRRRTGLWARRRRAGAVVADGTIIDGSPLALVRRRRSSLGDASTARGAGRGDGGIPLGGRTGDTRPITTPSSSRGQRFAKLLKGLGVGKGAGSRSNALIPEIPFDSGRARSARRTRWCGGSRPTPGRKHQRPSHGAGHGRRWVARGQPVC